MSRAERGFDIVGERRLWRSVLSHAVRDALGWGGHTNSNPSSDHLAMRRARSWIGTADFRAVCDLAGFAPSAAEARLKALIPLADAGQGKPADFAILYGRVFRRGPVPGSARICAMPGCGTVLGPGNAHGLCNGHAHAPGLCCCAQCQRRKVPA